MNLNLFGHETLKIASISDLALVSSKELSLPDDNIKEEAISILKQGSRAIIVTMGSEGSMLVEEDGIKKLSTFKTKVMDTTGVGDAFMAGLIFRASEGLGLITCIRFETLWLPLKWEFWC